MSSAGAFSDSLSWSYRALRRELYGQHVREVASSSFGAGLALSAGAAVILTAGAMVPPLAGAVVVAVALLTGGGVVLGRQRASADCRADLKTVLWRRLPHRPRRSDLAPALGRSVDDFATVYLGLERSPTLRSANSEYQLLALLGQLLLGASKMAQWLELLDDQVSDPETPPWLPSGGQGLSQASAERYQQAMQGFERTRAALQDERQSLEIDFRAAITRIQDICLAAKQIEIGQARLDTLISAQVLNTQDFLDGVRSHVRALDQVVTKTIAEGGSL